MKCPLLIVDFLENKKFWEIESDVKMSNPIIVVEDTTKSLEDISRSTPIYKPKNSSP